MSLRRKAQKAMLAMVFLARLWTLAPLLLNICALLLAWLVVFAREFVLDIGANIVDSAVEFVEDERHAAWIGRALLLVGVSECRVEELDI